MDAPVFTYLFYDLLSNTKLAELPLANPSFGSQLNGAGPLTAQLNIADKRVKEELNGVGGDQNSPLSEAKTAVYVDMDGDLMWGGILWTARPNSGTRIATLGAAEFWSYFASQRRIAWNADYTAVSGVGPMDQILIFKDIIDTAQLQSGGDIGVITTGNPVSGVQIEIKWDASQLTQIGQAVSQIAQQAAGRGFDFAIDVAWDTSVSPKVPRKQLTLSYPRRGRIAGQNSVSFDTGNKWAQPYDWPRDGTQAANVMYGIGAGSGPTTAAGQGGLRSTQAYPAAFAAGYPLLEGTLQRSDVTDQTTLDNMTIAKLAACAYPVVLPKLEFALDMPDPQFGSYIVGDDAEIVIPKGDEWFPAGLSEYKRLVGWTVTPANEGVGTVKLDFVDPPVVL